MSWVTQISYLESSIPTNGKCKWDFPNFNDEISASVCDNCDLLLTCWIRATASNLIDLSPGILPEVSEIFWKQIINRFLNKSNKIILVDSDWKEYVLETSGLEYNWEDLQYINSYTEDPILILRNGNFLEVEEVDLWRNTRKIYLNSVSNRNLRLIPQILNENNYGRISGSTYWIQSYAFLNIDTLETLKYKWEQVVNISKVEKGNKIKLRVVWSIDTFFDTEEALINALDLN